MFSKTLLVGRLLTDPKTPGWMKLVGALTVLYGLSPLDLMPDVVPLLGWVDDAAIIMVVVLFFAGRARKRFDVGGPGAARTTTGAPRVVEGTYRVADSAR